MKEKGQKADLPNKEDQVKELVALAEARVRIRRFLEDLKKSFPKKSKIQLLPVALHKGGILAAEMLIEDIERNQANKLSIDDRIFLQQVKNQLQEKRACLSPSSRG
ncbi:MAG: hypothetical protein WCK10_04080 [Candidatus Staskawiczbacteria bacterium]